MPGRMTLLVVLAWGGRPFRGTTKEEEEEEKDEEEQKNQGDRSGISHMYRRDFIPGSPKEVRGKDANVRADRLAQAMRGALPEAKIARPKRTSPIRLVGVYPTSTLTAIRCGLQEVRAGRLLDELEELLGTFLALPALVARDFNAQFPRWDPDGKGNPRGGLLCMWANRLNLSLGNQVGHPTCVRLQGSSVVDLTWRFHAASVRFLDWRVDEAESLSDHLYVIFKYRHEAIGSRGLRSRDIIFPKWNARAVDEDRLAAALVSGKWIRDDSDNVRDLVKRVNNTLLTSCDMSMSRVRTTVDRGRVVPWWSQEIAILRGSATAARRCYLRARRGGDPAEIRACLEDRRERKRTLVSAIRRAKASAWRDFIATIEDDPWGRPYKLVMGRVRARGVPLLSETLDPPLLTRIVATLFLDGGRSVAPNVIVEDPDVITITAGEVRRAAKRIDLGRAPGPDGIPDLVVKKAAIHCCRGLAECFTMLLRRGVFPRVWKRARLVLLKKKHDGDGGAPSTYRPICPLDEVGKLFERVVVSRVSEFLDCGNILSPCQHCFRVGHSILGAIEEVKDYIQECASGGQVGVLTLLDISNAFNSLPHETVIASMEGSGFPAYLVNIVKDYFRDQFLSFIGRQGHVNDISVMCRVPQGSVIGPILWNIAYDRVLQVPLPGGSRVVCYADDTVLLSAGRDLSCALSTAEHDLEILALIPRAEGILRSIGRTLPNLHGPREKKRRLYSSVIHSVLLNDAPVWWRAVVEDQGVKRAVAGFIPFDHLAPQLAEVYATLRDAEGPVPPNVRAALGAFARAGAVAAGKEEQISLTGVTGETVAQAVPGYSGGVGCIPVLLRTCNEG
ncbi:hypothetical protein M0804_014995 [Polistes exclamans]|nr:hypothetical protein M0804_014995 [Polistes exclamans]